MEFLIFCMIAATVVAAAVVLRWMMMIRNFIKGATWNIRHIRIVNFIMNVFCVCVFFLLSMSLCVLCHSHFKINPLSVLFRLIFFSLALRVLNALYCFIFFSVCRDLLLMKSIAFVLHILNIRSNCNGISIQWKQFEMGACEWMCVYVFIFKIFE